MDYTVEPLEDSSLADQLHEAVQHVYGTYQEAELPDLGEGESIQNTLPADPDVKNFSYSNNQRTQWYIPDFRVFWLRPERTAQKRNNHFHTRARPLS